jgi:hypothetical protein
MGLAIIVPSISFDDANLGKVTLSGNVPIRDLYINLENSYTGTTVDLRCSYLPANTTQRNVIWSIEEGSEYALISSSTLFINPSASNSPVTIKCTSFENPTINTVKTITLTYSDGGDVPILYDWLKTDASMASYVNIGKLGRNDILTITGKTLSLIFSDVNKACAIFGVAKTENELNWLYSIIKTDGSADNTLGYSTSNYIRPIDPNSHEFSIIINIESGYVQYEGESETILVNEAAFNNGETYNDCFVFAANKNGEAISKMQYDMYALKEFKIKRNNQVVHDFKPASYGSAKGLYDTVTNQFKPNLGTGDFILEND